MFIETLLDAFADDRFVKLTNYGDRWGIQWKPVRDGNVAEIFDDALDRLCETFVDVLEADAVAPSAESDDHSNFGLM